MALHITRELPSGVTTTYHRILRANFNFNPPASYVADGVSVLVELEIGEYLSEEHRRRGLEPARREVRTIPASEMSKSILQGIYSFLGAEPPRPEPEVNRDAEEGLPPPPPPVLHGYEGALNV